MIQSQLPHSDRDLNNNGICTLTMYAMFVSEELNELYGEPTSVLLHL